MCVCVCVCVCVCAHVLAYVHACVCVLFASVHKIEELCTKIETKNFVRRLYRIQCFVVSEFLNKNWWHMHS